MASDPLDRMARAGRRANQGAKEWGRYAGLGITFAFTILVFTLGGWWLDARLGSSPWLLLLGVLLGFTGGLISLVRRVPPAGAGRARSADPASTTERPDDPPAPAP